MDNTGHVMQMSATASFSLTVALIAWIEAESKRRGVSKSELVRDLLTDAKAMQEREAA